MGLYPTNRPGNQAERRRAKGEIGLSSSDETDLGAVGKQKCADL